MSVALEPVPAYEPLPSEAFQLVRDICSRCFGEESQAKALVEEAKQAGSPLAPYFTANERVAAYQWHLHEARKLIMRVHIQIRVEGVGTHILVPGLIKVSHKQDGYVPFEDVATCVDTAEKLKERFLHELALLCARYATYGVPLINPLIRRLCKTMGVKPPPLLYDGAKATA